MYFQFETQSVFQGDVVSFYEKLHLQVTVLKTGSAAIEFLLV